MTINFTDDDGQRWAVTVDREFFRNHKVGGLRRLKAQEAAELREEGDERSARAIESLTLMQWLEMSGVIVHAERR